MKACLCSTKVLVGESLYIVLCYIKTIGNLHKKEHFSMLCDLLSHPCVYWADGSFVVINDDVRSEISKTMHLAVLETFPPSLSLIFKTHGAKVINVMCFFHCHYLYASLIHLCPFQLFKLSYGYLHFSNCNIICLNQ